MDIELSDDLFDEKLLHPIKGVGISLDGYRPIENSEFVKEARSDLVDRISRKFGVDPSGTEGSALLYKGTNSEIKFADTRDNDSRDLKIGFKDESYAMEKAKELGGPLMKSIIGTGSVDGTPIIIREPGEPIPGGLNENAYERMMDSLVDNIDKSVSDGSTLDQAVNRVISDNLSTLTPEGESQEDTYMHIMLHPDNIRNIYNMSKALEQNGIHPHFNLKSFGIKDKEVVIENLEDSTIHDPSYTIGRHGADMSKAFAELFVVGKERVEQHHHEKEEEPEDGDVMKGEKSDIEGEQNRDDGQKKTATPLNTNPLHMNPNMIPDEPAPKFHMKSPRMR